MKNTLWISFLFTLLVSGCSQEEMLKHTSSDSGGRVFTTSFENDESRTYVENGLYSRWTEGDRISLFDASTLNRQYLFGGETGASSGTFFMLSKPEGTGTALNANYAVYPYSPDVKMMEEGVISVALPAEQHYAENSFGLGDNMMVAVTENTDDTFLSFKNVGGAFKLQLYGDDVTEKSITLKGNNDEKVAGKATIIATYDKAPVVTMADDATTSITLYCGEKGVKIGASAEEATAFWMVVPPTTFEKGITVIVKDADNKIFTQTTDKQLMIERNVVKPMVAVEVIPENPKIAFSEDEVELEGWSAGLFVGEGTYVMGKPHSENGYIMTIGNILDNECAIVYMDESRQVREIFIDNTIIAFGEYSNGGVDVSIIEKGGTENIEHLVYESRSQSRSSDDIIQRDGIIGLINNSLSMYNAVVEISNNKGFSKKNAILFLANKFDSIGNFSKALGGPDWSNESFVSWLEVGMGGLSVYEFIGMYGSKALGGPVVGCILVYADLINTYYKHYDEHIKAYYGNSIAEIEDITFENKGLNIDVNISGYEPWYDLECGVIVKKSNLPFAPPVGKFPSNIETITVTQDGSYPFFVGDKEVDEAYWCYPFLIEKSRTPLWIGFIGDMAGPLVHYGKAIKYEPDNVPLREALIKLYNSTDGDNWIHNDNWCSDKPVMEWYGVGYDSMQEVYYISLDNNNLKGSINQTFPDGVGISLSCAENQLTSLDVSGCGSLTGLVCYNNPLTSVDVSNCRSLVNLWCTNNRLNSLNASNCVTLNTLVCSDNQLTSLAVSNCRSLVNLWCASNQLTSLDISDCVSLTHLVCNYNKLTSLDVSGCITLTELICHGNQLTSLDVSGCTALTDIYCYNNQITSLNITGCTALKSLECYDNKISSVIPDWFSQLEYFYYDQRYFYHEEFIDGKWVVKIEDAGYGWWYPGEPERGYHKKY